jgi:hypothetical protein
VAAKVEPFKAEEKAEPNGTSSDLRERILGIEDSRSEMVTVPEWENVEVEMRSLSVAEFRQTTQEMSEEPLFVALTIASAHDPATGEKLFRREDATVLKGKHMQALSRLGNAAMRLNGVGDDAAERAEKNSSETPPVSTSSP